VVDVTWLWSKGFDRFIGRKRSLGIADEGPACEPSKADCECPRRPELPHQALLIEKLKLRNPTAQITEKYSRAYNGVVSRFSMRGTFLVLGLQTAVVIKGENLHYAR
jgi:hypothetical protein